MNGARLTGRLSSAERDTIASLADRGLSAGQIALRMNRHPGTINFAMHALGLKQGPAPADFDYVRAGRRVKSFSREEGAFIQALRVQGYTTTFIAEMVGKRFGHIRSAATINIRLKMLANAEACA